MMKKYNSIIIFVSILLSVAFARDPYSSHGSYNPYNPHGLRNPYRPHDSFGFQNQQSAQQISPAEYAVQKWPHIKSNFSQYRIQVQSPTNINTSYVTPAVLSPVTIHLLNNVTSEAVVITNTGYYLEMRLLPGTRVKPYVTGGPLLQERYLFEQIHFHWSNDDKCGSEHHVDGKCFSVEVHIVMYNQKYGSNNQATRYPDGIAVISFFGEVSPEDNPNFKGLVHKMSYISAPESNTTGSFHKEFNFVGVLFDQTTYYTFPGSLTTSPYSECVTWIMYSSKPFRISSRQINAFRKLRDKNGNVLIRGNDRLLQPFGNRPLTQPLINREIELSDKFNDVSVLLENKNQQRKG